MQFSKQFLSLLKNYQKIGGSIMSTNTYETTSNPPGSVRSFSNFGDSACGEPLLTQHLRIDFTPNEETDTDFLQRKVCAFWKFVGVTPELRDILVLPEPDMFKRTASSDISPETVKSDSIRSSDSKVLTKERTAVSMLEFVEGKGLIDRTFESRLPQSMCSLGSREYHENEMPTDFDTVTLQKKGKSGNTYQRHLKYSKRTQTIDHRPAKTKAEVRNMCKNMQKWDRQHPRSMQGPQHPYSSHRLSCQKSISS